MPVLLALCLCFVLALPLAKAQMRRELDDVVGPFESTLDEVRRAARGSKRDGALAGGQRGRARRASSATELSP
jgi:hypothetical protein